jgi:hypothetical protein
MTGTPVFIAKSMICRSCARTPESEPPKTVKSWAKAKTAAVDAPRARHHAVTRNALASMPKWTRTTKRSISANEPLSRRTPSARARLLPALCCRSICLPAGRVGLLIAPGEFLETILRDRVRLLGAADAGVPGGALLSLVEYRGPSPGKSMNARPFPLLV